MNFVTRQKPSADRKRIGQFFSGTRLGRLLAALADARACETIIDPMAGNGDLLQACLDIGSRPQLLAGIEIDEAARAAAVHRLPTARIAQGNAFSVSTLRKLGRVSFDLVIANPPFVRYQDMTKAHDDVPSAEAVREDLAATISHLAAVGPLADANALMDAVAGYSGFADLALPSCLLCMALTAPGGRLALVLPQSWLARNYAEPLRSCLQSGFEIEAVIEDEGATWFPSALVRTSLLIATRRSALKATSVFYTKVALRPEAATATSLVGTVEEGATTPIEVDFAEAVRAVATGRKISLTWPGTTLEFVSQSPSQNSSSTTEVRSRKAQAQSVETPGITAELTTLSRLGVAIGQGLRTGANDFFYVRPIDGGAAFVTSERLGSKTIANTDAVLRAAIRDQRLSGRSSETAILDLRAVALPEDITSFAGASGLRPMSGALAAHVRKAGRTLSGKAGREKPIKDLSAVRTNVRAEGRGRPPRFWYMLPDFQKRHEPDVYLARVCGGRPQALTVASPGTLVDANFITFRCSECLTPTALLAILNSVWAWDWLEASGAVMGGGALKIESTMLSRLPIPRLDERQMTDLHTLGLELEAAPPQGAVPAVDEILLRHEVQAISSMLKQKYEAASSRAATRARRRPRRSDLP